MTQNQRQLAPLRFAGVLVFAALLSITNVAAQSRIFNPSPAGSLGLDSQSAVVPRTSLASANWPDIVSGPFEFFSAYSISKSTGIVTVDCNKGDSINQALTKSPLVRNLTVEISGVCHENVVVTRDHVTLHGTDPANDGIQADLSDEISDVALWVRQAQLVTVENLKLTGGFSGLLVTNVTLDSLRLINCRLESNGAYGAQLQNALVVAQDSTFSTNGNINAGVFGGSRLQCTGCTFADPQGTGALGTIRENVLAFAANHVLLTNCTLTNGGITSDDSLVLLTDSTISGFGLGAQTIFAFGSSSVALTRVQINGSMVFNRGANAQLLGVTQTSSLINQMDDSAYVRIADASPAAGGPPSIPSMVRGFALRNFSKATLLQTSHVNGNFNCSQGADAFCSTPTNVSGTSNCGLCPKP
ncbi:MAG TPA: right-handed parallel beta-helix repeat-containing protein [Pyrinomonadaceae bacterium]|nr:right-handed parallel beta-helix repeat-containing protein [Pyrinomonadaceae bacterium]